MSVITSYHIVLLFGRKLQVPKDDSFVLNGIAVREEYHRKGYGTLLLQAFEETAKEYGATEVSLGFVVMRKKLFSNPLTKLAETFLASGKE